MKSAMEIIKEMRSKVQYKKSVEIMGLLSQYRADCGHKLSPKELTNDLNINIDKYKDLLAGDTRIKPQLYNKVIQYIHKKYMNRCALSADVLYEGHDSETPIINYRDVYVLMSKNIVNKSNHHSDKRLSKSNNEYKGGQAIAC